jgi:uncharacterized membrane protein YhhN
MLLWKTLMLLALVVWTGGLVFFFFIAAPTAFIVLPSTSLAGNVVASELFALHWIGLVSGVIFLIASLLYSRARFARARPLMLVNVLVVIMLTLTLISQFAITPRVHALRAQLPPSGAPPDAIRTEFDRMHTWSTRLETGVLVLGLGVVILTARRF